MFSNVKSGGLGKQEKTVTATTAAIEVTPDVGKSLVKVTIKPTPTEDKTVTPSDSVQTVTPPYGKHLGTVTVEAVPDSEKKGLYAWNKYNYSEKPSMVATSNGTSDDGFYIYNSDDYQVTASDFSLSVLDGGQTVGTSKTIYFKYKDNKLYWSYTKGGADDYQYRVTTNSSSLLIVATDYSCDFTGLTGIEFAEPSIGDFVDFVVSDSESAYPDGGTQGGYWCEKVQEISNVIGDEVNFYIGEVYSEFTKTIAHGLGRKPDYFGITSAIPGSNNILYKVAIDADDTNIIFNLKYYTAYRDATFQWFAITIGR